ncbi:MAG: copper transporter [Chthonomonadales bacterium]
MSPGFRYHVVTICAVFLALGVGIVIGSSFVQSAIVAAQTRVVKDLSDKFNKEVQGTRTQLKRYQSLVTFYSKQMEGKLSGVKVAIIQTGDYPDAVKSTRDSLERSGASITSVTTIERTFGARAAINLSKVLEQLKRLHPDLPDTSDAIIRVVAASISRGGGDSDLANLETAKLLHYEGDFKTIPDYVIIVGGATIADAGRTDLVDLPLIAQLKDLRAAVVAVEPETAEISYIPAWKTGDITSVDNVDSDIGSIALILALKSQRGSYGVKSSASNGLMPAPVNDDLRRNSGL